MATIKATTIENLDEELNVTEDLNILIQSSEPNRSKTKRTTLKNLKSIFAAAGGTTQPEGEGESDGYQGLNSFDSFEYASEQQIDSFSEVEDSGMDGVCYQSQVYTANCETEEIYLHFDASLSSTQDMSNYPDAYMALQIRMPNDDLIDTTTFKWRTICRKPIWDIGKLGVRSIDFHFCIETDMQIRALIYGGSKSTSSVLKIIPLGTHINMTITAKSKIPTYDSSTYLKFSNKDLYLSFEQSRLSTDYAVEVYALGSSSLKNNEMNVKIRSGGLWQDTGYVAKYTAANADIGRQFLGKFYFNKSKKIDIGLSRAFSSTNQMYILANYCTEDETLSNEISAIEKNTISSDDSLVVESRGDFAFSGVSLHNNVERSDAVFQYPEGAIATIHCKVDANRICGEQSNSGATHRICYFNDDFRSYTRSETGTPNPTSKALTNCNTTINAIRFNKNYASVPKQAFWGCTSLSSVSFGKNSNTSLIGDEAFKFCPALKSVDMSGSKIASIGKNAFYQCTNLQTVKFTDQTETICYRAFYQCTSLKKVFLPIGVKTLDQYAFQGCTALTELYLPYNFTTVNKDVIYGMSEFATNGGQLYIIIPKDISGYSAAWATITSNIEKLDTLYNVAGFKKDGKVTLICVNPSGEKFVYEEGGLKYNLGIIIDGVKSAGTPKIILVS